MTETQYRRAKEIFLEVCDLDPEDRQNRIERECAGNEALRAEVESLVHHYAAGKKVGGQKGVVGPTTPTIIDGDDRTAHHHDRIGPYRIQRELDRGGMGIVYLAVRDDERFRQRVAIKVLEPRYEADREQFLRRFELERQVLASLSHPNIATLHDGGETEDGNPYFVMEYVEGMTLDRYCDTHRLRIEERLQLFTKICDAVHCAHQNQVVHRDLKPGNILVRQDGEPILLDFGIAKLINPGLGPDAPGTTLPGSSPMTPEYSSPEQVRGDPISTASDIYSLGVILYELVSGHRPYQLPSRMRSEIARVICEEDPEKPSTASSRSEVLARRPQGADTSDITPELVSRTRETRPGRLRRRLAGDIDNIVLMAMRKEPQRRYASVDAFADDIRRHICGLPVRARPDTWSYRTAKFVRRNRAAMAAALFMTLSLLGGMTVGAIGWSETANERDRASDYADQLAVERNRVAGERDRASEYVQLLVGLSNEFLGDFHDEIQTLDGSLAARELLVETAYEILESLEREAEAMPELRLALARAHDAVGDIHGGLRNPSEGDVTKALERYERAISIRQEMMTESPDERALMDAMAASHENIGDVRRRTGSWGGAVTAYRARRAIREQLLERDPNARETARLQVRAPLSDLGNALIRTSRVAEGKALVIQSFETRASLAAEFPDDKQLQRDLSVICLRVGYRHEVDGEWREAIRFYERALDIRLRLAASAEASDARARRDVASARLSLANLLVSMDEYADADDQLDRFMRETEYRNGQNPNDRRTTRDLALGHQLRGRYHARRGEWDDALRESRSFRAIIMPLALENPRDMYYQSLLAQSHTAIGDAFAGRGDIAGAIDEGRSAANVYRAVCEVDKADIRSSVEYAGTLTKLAGWLRELGDTDDALHHLETAQELCERIVGPPPGNSDVRRSLASVLGELCRVIIVSGVPEQALVRAERAIEIAPEPTPALLHTLALALELNGRREEAIVTGLEALQLLEGMRDAASARLREVVDTDLRRLQGR